MTLGYSGHVCISGPESLCLAANHGRIFAPGRVRPGRELDHSSQSYPTFMERKPKEAGHTKYMVCSEK